MAPLAGILLALIVAALAKLARLDRERGFYPTILVVVASYYLLFAAMKPDGAGMVTEVVYFILFGAAAIVGLRAPRIIIVALVAHGLFDAMREELIRSSGTPDWWPGFCLAFDLILAARLAIGGIRSARHEIPQS